MSFPSLITNFNLDHNPDLNYAREYNDVKSEVDEKEGEMATQLEELRADVRKCNELKRELDSFSENPAQDVKELELGLQQIGGRQEEVKKIVREKKALADEQNGKKLKLQQSLEVLRDNIRVQVCVVGVEIGADESCVGEARDV